MADSSKNKIAIAKATKSKASTKPATEKLRVSVVKSETTSKAKVTTKPKFKGATQVKKAKVGAKSKTAPNVKSASAMIKSETSTKVKAAVKTNLSMKQSVKDLLSNPGKDVSDLNASTDYPIHPNRIWPD